MNASPLVQPLDDQLANWKKEEDVVRRYVQTEVFIYICGRRQNFLN